MRQHERLTRADRETEERVNASIRGNPTVHHLVQSTPED
jgi:hypothetical protein